MLRGAAATHLRRHIITQRRRIATPEAIRAVAVDPSGSLTPRAVDLATLREQVIKPQGWPVARAARRPDACDAEARAAPRLLCRLVGAVRRSPWSARLRTFVGFDVRGYFVDGPLITIVAVISAAAMAPALVSRAFARAPVGIDSQ